MATTGARKLYARLKDPLACPHCGRLARTYRRSQERWICGGGRCGRSFLPTHGHVADAEITDDPDEPQPPPQVHSRLYR